jgi:hypothetical protein
MKYGDRMDPSDESESMRKADEAPGFYDWRKSKSDFKFTDSNVEGLFDVIAKLVLKYDANGYNCAWDVVRIVRRYEKEVR